MTARAALDKDALRSLLTTIRDTSWSWREADVPALAARFGWDSIELMPDLGAVVDPGHGLGSKAFRLAFDKGQVDRITMRISSLVGKNDADGQVFLSDVFADALAVATEVLGAPTSRKPGARPEARWRGDQATLILTTMSVGVTLTWASTAFQDHWDTLAQG